MLATTIASIEPIITYSDGESWTEGDRFFQKMRRPPGLDLAQRRVALSSSAVASALPSAYAGVFRFCGGVRFWRVLF
jgi:hypothetical protein